MLDTLEHQQDHLDTLHRAMAERRFLVLTGAGISTSSGIPDYRDSEGVRRGKAPMMYQEFLATAQARRRYWARAMLGWPRVRIAQPNNAHRALATLQQRQHISGLITQNVDTLHDQAGSHDVIELHGSLHRVLCLDCQLHSTRDLIQRQMEIDNPYLAQVHAVQAPDGDTLLDPAFEERFQVPRCPHCQGERLKPDVVFFWRERRTGDGGQGDGGGSACRGAAGGRFIADGLLRISPVQGNGRTGQAGDRHQPGQDPG